MSGRLRKRASCKCSQNPDKPIPAHRRWLGGVGTTFPVRIDGPVRLPRAPIQSGHSWPHSCCLSKDAGENAGSRVEINIFGRLGGLDRVGPCRPRPESVPRKANGPPDNKSRQIALARQNSPTDRSDARIGVANLDSAAGPLGSKVAGQAGDSDPRQDQIAAVVGQIMKSGGPLRLIPTDKLIPC